MDGGVDRRNFTESDFPLENSVFAEFNMLMTSDGDYRGAGLWVWLPGTTRTEAQRGSIAILANIRLEKLGIESGNGRWVFDE